MSPSSRDEPREPDAGGSSADVEMLEASTELIEQSTLKEDGTPEANGSDPGPGAPAASRARQHRLSVYMHAQGIHLPSTHALHLPHAHLPSFHVHFTQKERDVLQMVGNIAIIALLYVFLLLMLGGHHLYDDLLPGGKAWAMVLIWLCSSLGGALSQAVKVPPLLGNLVAGIILKNINPDPVQAFPSVWGETIRLAGLATILMRSGLELDVPAVKSAGMCALRLTLCPGVSEAITTGGFATLIFGMPVALGVSLGFILAAVSPAVVVVGMFTLQRQGYGVAKGIPSLVVAAASFDDVIAISGFSMAIGLAIPSDHSSLAENILHGPLTIIFGVLLGVLGGFIISITRVWNVRWKRTVATFSLGMVFMFGSAKLHYSGSGAMGGLIMGMAASVLWASGKPGWAAKRADAHYAHRAEADLAFAWELVFQPLLFGVIGTALDFRVVERSTIPKAIGLVLIGLCVRTPAAYAATYGRGLNFKERAFIALAWLPKATVQAAYAALPLDLARQLIDEDDSKYDDYEKWGQQILTTAVLSILISAPLGLLFIQVLGTKWLTCDNDSAAPRNSASTARDSHTFADGRSTSASTASSGSVASAVEAGSMGGRETNEMNLPPSPALVPTTSEMMLSTAQLHSLMVELDEMMPVLFSAKAAEDPDLAQQARARLLVRRARVALATMNRSSKLLDTAGNFFRLTGARDLPLPLRPTHSDESLHTLEAPPRDAPSMMRQWSSGSSSLYGPGGAFRSSSQREFSPVRSIRFSDPGSGSPRNRDSAPPPSTRSLDTESRLALPLPSQDLDSTHIVGLPMDDGAAL